LGHLVRVEVTLLHGSADLRIPVLGNRGQEGHRPEHFLVAGPVGPAGAIDPQADFAIVRVE